MHKVTNFVLINCKIKVIQYLFNRKSQTSIFYHPKKVRYFTAVNFRKRKEK